MKHQQSLLKDSGHLGAPITGAFFHTPGMTDAAFSNK
jgi:hypothetical protein